jgi:hypothetical protein
VNDKFLAANLVIAGLAHYNTSRRCEAAGHMVQATRGLGRIAVAMAWALAVITGTPAGAQDGFPFGSEMTLDTARQPGSRRLPTLEIGDSGEARLDLWCKSGKGQFSVAGNTVIFAAGPLEDRGCAPARAQADDALVEALNAVATWKRQGDLVSFIGTRPLRFRLNTN